MDQQNCRQCRSSMFNAGLVDIEPQLGTIDCPIENVLLNLYVSEVILLCCLRQRGFGLLSGQGKGSGRKKRSQERRNDSVHVLILNLRQFEFMLQIRCPRIV